MPITRMDHFTVLTKDAIATAEFYGSILGLEPGPRPNFSFPGVWLYSEGKPILHVVEKDEIPTGTGVLDHMAFWGTDLAGFIGLRRAASPTSHEAHPTAVKQRGFGSCSSVILTARGWRSTLPPMSGHPSRRESGCGTRPPDAYGATTGATRLET